MRYSANLQGSAQSAFRETTSASFPRAQWPLVSGEATPATMTLPRFTMAIQEPWETAQVWYEAGGSTVRLSPIIIQWLERLYTFRERAEVFWFLERHPLLASLLLEAYNEIGLYFPRSPLFLEVVTDPEASDDHQLVVFISTDLDADAVGESLRQFDKGWWLDALDRAQGNLCITVEFR